MILEEGSEDMGLMTLLPLYYICLENSCRMGKRHPNNGSCREKYLGC